MTETGPADPAQTALLCLADILRNLMLWSLQSGWDFEAALRIAQREFEAGNLEESPH